jgi:hypothetical protein
MRDEATVDYVRSPHGLVVPITITHRQHSGSSLVVENVFRYSPFRAFAAQTKIKY